MGCITSACLKDSSLGPEDGAVQCQKFHRIKRGKRRLTDPNNISVSGMQVVYVPMAVPTMCDVRHPKLGHFGNKGSRVSCEWVEGRETV